MQLDTLRLRLIKIGGRVRQLLTVVRGCTWHRAILANAYGVCSTRVTDGLVNNPG